MTNFDKITANPEILAAELADIMYGVGCDDCPADTVTCDIASCTAAWLAWLRREAGE